MRSDPFGWLKNADEMLRATCRRVMKTKVDFPVGALAQMETV